MYQIIWMEGILLNFKWSYIILLMLLFLCATVCVSATETNNTYDVTTSDASCENLNEEISEDIKNGYLSCTNDSDIQASGEGTFSQLNSEISSHTGSIKLNKDYKFNPTSDKSITIAKNIIIDGNGHTIDGSNRVRCININANLKVTLKNLTIMNGYSTAKGAGIRTGDNVELLLINCVFKNNKVYNANGAALTTGLYSNIKIHNSYFENNTSIRESNKSWGEFKAGMGSAIYAISGTNLTISQSRFTSNNAYLSTILLVSFYGDKILKTSNLNVDNCYFNNNTSNSHGVIYLDEFGQGIIANSTFIHNKSPGGGSILILDSCPYAIVKNCSFIENIGNTGGAIRMSRYNSTSFCNAEIYDCKFINNHGSYGGAINLVTGSTLKLYNSTFMNNVATNNGGAIYTQESSTLSVYNSSFTNNKAAGGGAIYCSKSALNIYDSTFDNNKADSSGGAIRITSGGNCELNINNSTFNSNTAKANGGAIYSTVKTTIKSSYFNSNTGISGGAICMANSQNSKLNCYNSSFNTNKDNSGGSAIYSNVESFNRIIIQKSDFENDKIWIKKDDCKIVIPYLTFTVSNVVYPDKLDINVKSNVSGTYIIKVGNKKQTVKLNANTAKTVRFEGLSAGEYNVEMIYTETTNYNNILKKASVKILKASSKVTINPVGNHNYGQNFDIGFNVVNRTSVTYTVKSKSGKIAVANTKCNSNTISIPVLNVGEYVISVANSENENYTGFVASAAFTILKVTPSINVNTVNVNYPNDVVVNVHSDIDGTYIVKVGDNSQPVDLKANTPKQARFTGLDAGNYNVSVSCIETVNYYSVFKNTPVKILKASSEVSINTIGNHEYGKGFDVNFHVVNPTTVTYIVKSKSGNVVVANTSTSNLNKITIPVLNTGEYIITIANSGNKNYAGDVDSASFTILKTTPTINVNTVNVNYPNDVVVNVHSDIDGTYIVKVGDNSQPVDLKANTPKQARFTGLDAGNYNVSVSCIETVNYYSVFKNTPVKILKASSEVSINTIGNHEYGKGFDVNFHVVNHTSVSYIIKSKNGNVVVNATADSLNKISIPVLDAGEYIVTVFNCENENYTGDEASVNFTILKVTPNITVSVSDVGYPGNVIINVKSDVTGSYTVRVGKVSKTVDLVENKQSKVVFNGLNPGSYDVFVGYDGNINYNSVLKNTIVKVFKADSSVVINPISNVTYNNPTSIEFNIINRTKVTYIVKSISGEIVVKNTTVSGNSADISNLAVGNYIITIANAENDCYNGYEQSKEFTISKATNNVEVNVVNTLLPDSVAVNIKADVDGVYNVSFGEFSVCVNVESGEGFAKIDLPMGIDYITTTSFADTQNYTLNIKEAKLNVSKRVNNIKIEVDSVTYPNNITVKVTAEIAGIYIVDINGSEINISIKENNGCGLKTVHLIPGNYTAKVINSTSNFYESNITECNFTVFKGLNIVKVFVEDVECGYCTDIYVTASVKGNYTININGSDVLVEVINDGSTGVITTDKFTKAGEYYANVTSKLEYYDETFINCVFTVFNNIRIFVEVSDNVSVGNPVFISVLMDKLINGSVNIKVDDTDHIVDVVDGSANYTICDACEGMHNIVVLYLDDDNNVIKSARANFTVKNNEGIVIDPDVAFSYLNINDTPVFSINLPANAMGNLTILVDGKYYNSVSLVDGKANVNISNLSNSAHDITMLYSGDYNYPCMNKTFNVSVLKPDYRPVKITPFFKFLKVKKHILKHFNCAKIVKVILKTKKGKKLGKVKVTFKFNKKSLKKIKAKNKKGKKLLKKLKKGYTVRTNIKGVFTLKLKNKYLTFKKGKYAFTVTFKGNNIYNKATKKGKIKIK